MTDPEPSSLSTDLVFTGPADQILAALFAILRTEQDYPGLKLSGRIVAQLSTGECTEQKAPTEMTIPELLGYPRPPGSGASIGHLVYTLRRAEVLTVAQLLEKTEEDLLAIEKFGQKSLDEVKAKLAGHGLELRR